MNPRIVRNIIETQNDNRIAITSESSSPLKFVDLKSLIERISKQLSGNGICLLYTSPSPRDRSLSRMPSSA